jgi:hypothetical protein
MWSMQPPLKLLGIPIFLGFNDKNISNTKDSGGWNLEDRQFALLFPNSSELTLNLLISVTKTLTCAEKNCVKL